MQRGAASAYGLQRVLRNIIASVQTFKIMTAPLTLNSLPLFPLHTVLFPGGHLPLRIFETRYRTMVRQCREAGAPFGVVTLTHGHEVQTMASALGHFHHFGTMAMIDSLSPMHSGLEMLCCTGKDRFAIQSARKLPHGLWVADVELLAPDQAVAVPDDLRQTALALYQVLHKTPLTHPEMHFDDCGWVANRWCELLPMPESTQLRLLALPSPLLRLELITDALERAGIVS